STSRPPMVVEAVATLLPTDYKLYRPPTSRPAAQRAHDLPDDFYTPTAADLKNAQAMLHARTEALNNRPLLTQEMRDRAERERENKWPTTRIRVRFPDGTQLEKRFPSTDKIRSVYAFVRTTLHEDVKPIKFVLYQLPARELKVSDLKVRDLSLTKLDLAPASVLQLRFLDDSLNHPTVGAPLAPEVLATAIDLPAPPDFDGSSDARGGSSGARPRTGGFAPTAGDKKVPKWLKIG
ncbi:hypothetical protein K488DRAFT_25221, partial [Vararia minispora EC-137]